MKKFTGFEHGMGIGGWLTNYKRFNVLPNEKRYDLTIGDFEHCDSYISESDVAYIKELGMDHIRLGFDQIVVKEKPGIYREGIMNLVGNFVDWCRKYVLNVVLNLHKAIGNYCDIDESVQLHDNVGLQDRFIALWEKFEDYFSDREFVAFELLNEVRDVPPEKWNNLAEKTINAIRKKNKTRKIIIGSVCWNSPNTLCVLKLYDDENIIYTFHTYEPFCFTHQQGVLEHRNMYYNRKMPYPGDIEMYRDFDRVIYGKETSYENYTVMDKKFIFDNLQPAADFIKQNPDKILCSGNWERFVTVLSNTAKTICAISFHLLRKTICRTAYGII